MARGARSFQALSKCVTLPTPRYVHSRSSPNPVIQVIQGFLWRFIMQVRSIKSPATDDELNLQALSPPWRLRGGPETSKFLIKAQSSCQPACFLKPSRCLPRVTSLEQKQLPLSSSLRKFKGLQEFCVRNLDKDQIYYFQIQIISQ